MNVYLNSQKINLKPNMVIGKGGEADIYHIGHGQAVKIFKQPDHPDLAGLPEEQESARERLQTHQTKLPDFPSRLPPRVIKPDLLATDRNGTILGYSMKYVASAEVLNRYADRSFRQAGIPDEVIREIFLDLHQSVRQLHREGVVIGDFNDLNVMIKDSQAWLIDADSFQFGHYLCRVFTTRFVDPLLCRWEDSQMTLINPHGTDSDWYAFAVMLMQCLLFVDPYGGVYCPKDRKNRIPAEERPRQRLTIFHPEVRYPKPALHFRVLPDDWLHLFQQIFEKDHRSEWPLPLIEDLRWTTCTQCGAKHARPTCPVCAPTAPAAVKSTTTIRGQVMVTQLFKTNGHIVLAAFQGGKMRWLTYENHTFRRETGAIILEGQIEPGMHFRIHRDETMIGFRGQLLTLSGEGQIVDRRSVDSRGCVPIFDANSRHRYWVQNGRLVHSAEFAPEFIGDVLENQTLFWVGEQFGFGFYHAGNLNVVFTFSAARTGLNDRVALPPRRGQLIDSTCFFSDDYAWFFAARRDRGKTIHHAILIHSTGRVEASLDGEFDADHWLSTLRGKCAFGRSLFAASENGLIRVEPKGGTLTVTREFPNTEPLVAPGGQLFAGDNGLYVVDLKSIRHLRMRSGK